MMIWFRIHRLTATLIVALLWRLLLALPVTAVAQEQKDPIAEHGLDSLVDLVRETAINLNRPEKSELAKVMNAAIRITEFARMFKKGELVDAYVALGDDEEVAGIYPFRPQQLPSPTIKRIRIRATGEWFTSQVTIGPAPPNQLDPAGKWDALIREKEGENLPADFKNRRAEVLDQLLLARHSLHPGSISSPHASVDARVAAWTLKDLNDADAVSALKNIGNKLLSQPLNAPLVAISVSRELDVRTAAYLSDVALLMAAGSGGPLPVAGPLIKAAPHGADLAAERAATALDRARQQAGTLYQRSVDGGIRVYQRTAEGTVRAWQRSRGSLELVEKKAGQPAVAYQTSLRSAAAAFTSNPAIGGVRLAYGADVFQKLLDHSDNAETSLLQVDGPIRLVSLKALLSAIRAAGGQLDRMDPAARSLGGLSRIYGYLIEPSAKDVVLVGSQAARGQAIRADDLVVGLKLVYRDGIVPMISLDPDPTDLSGPQKVRLIGVPRDTHFARVMVEADYAMKKIVFGAAPVTAGSFRSASELALDRLQQGLDATGYNRYWLTPIQPGPSDIRVAPANDEALFLGRVQVLTEALELTSAGLTGTSAADPVSEDAARRFSANYQAIAAQYPVFRTLEGLNDVVLLASILRKAQIKETVLQDLADIEMRISDAPLPASFPAIIHTQRRDGKEIGMVGGVNLRPVALKSKWTRYQDQQLSKVRALSARLAASGQLSLDAGIDSLVISPPRGTRGEAERLLELGAGELQTRDYTAAERDFSQALAADATLTEAYVGRAMANARQGNSRRAFRDARKALELDPDDDDVAAMTLAIGLESGQDLSVLLNPSVATPAARARAAGLFIKRGVARIAGGRTNDAEQDLSWAIALDQGNAEAYLLRGAMKVELAVAATGTRIFDEYKKPAFADLDRAIELNPGLGSAYAARSKLNSFDRNYRAAVEDASKAIRLDSSDAASYSYRGIARAFLRNTNEALEDLSKAVELAPYDGRMYFNRGLVRAMTADKDAAIEDFADAILRSPTLREEVTSIMKNYGLVNQPTRR